MHLEELKKLGAEADLAKLKVETLERQLIDCVLAGDVIDIFKLTKIRILLLEAKKDSINAYRKYTKEYSGD